MVPKKKTIKFYIFIIDEVKARTFVAKVTKSQTNDQLKTLILGNDSESIVSTSSGSSRPPTPFSRPVTATVIQRPKTTTISERAELNMTEEGEEVDEDNNEEILDPIEEALAPPKIKRTHSRNGVDSENHRKLSRHIAEDDEDIMKMKEYMEQKGL